MTLELLTDLIGFFIFVVLQSLFINGVYESFQGGCVNDMQKGKVCSGNILYMISPSFFEKYKGSYWSKPLFSCVKCMSSVYGALTFWPTVVYLFGFYWVEIPIYIFDVGILISLNWYVYKKL